jgi:hypothetical protein
VYSPWQKEEFSFPTLITCGICRKSNSYYENEIQQERYDLTCDFCKGRFFIRRMPQINVMCPHCQSLLRIDSDGSMDILQEGMQPLTTRAGTLTGVLTGAVIGAILAEESGVLLGTMAGALLGASADVREASYVC